MRKEICCFNVFIMFVLCVIFISCNTTNITISTGKSEIVQAEVKQNSGMSALVEGIPILAWYGVQGHTAERYLELKECGIDYNLTFYSNVEDLALAMDAAYTAGVKMIINCTELGTDPEHIVSYFKDHPAIAGYYLSDEPNSNDFPYLGEMVRRIQAVDNKHFCYINLYPNYASSKQFGTTTYLKHVQLFLQEVPVPFLSFTYYPIMTNSRVRYLNRLRRIVPSSFYNWANTGVRSIRKRWYENLEIISDEAHKVGRPFWAFALTTAHGRYSIPTLADLRLQVYSNLAYGAQGIQYFTYWTPPLANEKEDFHDGPIDINTQQKTTAWYTVKQMNKEIKGLSNVFLGAQVIQVRHIVKTAFGTNGAVPPGTTRFNFAKRPAEANIIKTFIIPNSTNAVVSFLKNGNRCYMVVINRNLSGGDDVTFTITGGEGLQLIKKDGTAVPASSESSNQTVTPGDALIYGWDN